VRARSDQGVWGAWSKTFSFTAIAPAVPVNPDASFDRANRVVHLSWHRGISGTPPVRFRIYGSEERGFSANDKPFEYNAGLDGTQHAPANLLMETGKMQESVEIPASLWRPYYRVEAVDADPLIVTTALAAAHVRRFYREQVDTSASIGHLVSADENGKSYQLRYRTGDELTFTLEGAPKGLTIDDHGEISGFVEEGAHGRYELKIRVKRKSDGAGDAVELPLTVEP
jgi:hypothetical protein